MIRIVELFKIIHLHLIELCVLVHLMETTPTRVNEIGIAIQGRKCKESHNIVSGWLNQYSTGKF